MKLIKNKLFTLFLVFGLVTGAFGQLRPIYNPIIKGAMNLQATITTDVAFTSATTPYYFRTSLSAISGTHNNLRARGQSTAASASTSDVRGLYAQGVTNASLFGGTVSSIYANSIAKNATTTVTLRGILIDTETENTPTAITNMIGLHIRNKSTIAITTDNISLLIDNEKMGSGIVQDAGIVLKTTTWGSDVTAWTYGIDMNQTGAFGTADIRFSNGEILSNTTDGVLDGSGADFRVASYNFADATAVAGTGDATTIDFLPNLTSLGAGLVVMYVAEAANTGAMTLAIDGGDAKAVNESSDNSALEANDIRSGSVVLLLYDGTQWQQLSQSGN